MNGIHQILTYVDDVYLIDDIRKIEINADVLLYACKDIGLAGKIKHIEKGRHPGMIANEHIRIGINFNEEGKSLNI